MISYNFLINLWYWSAFALLRMQGEMSVAFSFSLFPHCFFYLLFIVTNVVYIFYLVWVIITTIIQEGFVHFAFLAFSVLISQVMVVYAKMLLLMKGRSVAWFLCRCARVWGPLRNRRNLDISRGSIGYVLLWVLNSLVLAFGVFVLQPQGHHDQIFLLQPLQNTFPAFSSVIGVLGQVHMIFVLFEFTLAALCLDVAPLMLSMKLSTTMAAINDDFANVLGVQVGPDFDHEKQDKEEIGPFELKMLSSSLRELTSLYNDVVSTTLFLFNRVFGLAIAFSLKMVFAMCLFMAYLSFTTDLSQSLVFPVNTMQFLMRATIIMVKFGDVKQKACELRHILHLGSGKIRQITKDDNELNQQLMELRDSLEHTGIRAGSLYCYSHGLMLSFYGFLVTYLTILLQSI